MATSSPTPTDLVTLPRPMRDVVCAARGSNATNSNPRTAVDTVTASQNSPRMRMPNAVKVPVVSTFSTLPRTRRPAFHARLLRRFHVATDGRAVENDGASVQDDHVVGHMS